MATACVDSAFSLRPAFLPSLFATRLLESCSEFCLACSLVPYLGNIVQHMIDSDGNYLKDVDILDTE